MAANGKHGSGEICNLLICDLKFENLQRQAEKTSRCCLQLQITRLQIPLKHRHGRLARFYPAAPENKPVL